MRIQLGKLPPVKAEDRARYAGRPGGGQLRDGPPMLGDDDQLAGALHLVHQRQTPGLERGGGEGLGGGGDHGHDYGHTLG